jgi:hypothetical protein
VLNDVAIAPDGTIYASHPHGRPNSPEEYAALPKPSCEVAATIVKAVRSRRPKTRCSTRGGARLALFMRRALSDRGFDMIIRLTTDRARKSMNEVPT